MATQSRLLDLPYDIRFIIYQHLFPPGKQIYLQAFNKQLKSITPVDKIPVDLLLTCRQLHAEGSGYLYNSYLFNVVGRKQDCVDLYGGFEEVLKKYARGEVHVDPFSNGEHSATMCISLHVGDGKLDTVRDRQRGVRVGIEDIRQELSRQLAGGQNSSRRLLFQSLRQVIQLHTSRTLLLVVALLGALVAWYFRIQPGDNRDS